MGETKVRKAGAREMIGEMELFYPMTRVCTVTAAHDCTLQIFTPEAYWKLCELGNPLVYNIERFAIRRLSDRLSVLNREITARSEGGSRLHFDHSKPSFLNRLFGGNANKPLAIDPTEVLINSDMFNWAQQNLVASLAADFTVVEFAKDHVICEQGEEGEAMWIIGDGEVEIVVVTDEDDETGEIIGRLGTGHAFGDASIVMHAERTATCVARTPVAALQLTREKYVELHALDNEQGSVFRQGMIRNLVIHLLTTTRRFVALQPVLSHRMTPEMSNIWR